MEEAQKDLIGALLAYLRDEGLISQTIYSGSMERLYAVSDIPPLFRYPACGEELIL